MGNGSKQRPGRHGPWGKYLCVWCKLVFDHEPPVVLHVNVRGFDTGVLDELLGSKYDMVHIEAPTTHKNAQVLYSCSCIEHCADVLAGAQHMHI